MAAGSVLLGATAGIWGPVAGALDLARFKRLRAEGEQHPIEATGRELRKLMAWVKSHDSDYVEGALKMHPHDRLRLGMPVTVRLALDRLALRPGQTLGVTGATTDLPNQLASWADFQMRLRAVEADGDVPHPGKCL